MANVLYPFRVSYNVGSEVFTFPFKTRQRGGSVSHAIEARKDGSTNFVFTMWNSASKTWVPDVEAQTLFDKSASQPTSKKNVHMLALAKHIESKAFQSELTYDEVNELRAMLHRAVPGLLPVAAPTPDIAPPIQEKEAQPAKTGGLFKR